MASDLSKRVDEIKRTLSDRRFVRNQPLNAAYLDLERKVLENEIRAAVGAPREYTALNY